MTKKLSERVRGNDITLMYMDEDDWCHLDSTILAPEIENLEMELQQARHDLMVRESKKDEKIKKLTARCDLLFEGKSCAIASIESLERQRDALLEALKELVACKDLKARLEYDYLDFNEREDAEADYVRRKPAAWAAARSAIKSVEGEK